MEIEGCCITNKGPNIFHNTPGHAGRAVRTTARWLCEQYGDVLFNDLGKEKPSEPFAMHAGRLPDIAPPSGGFTFVQIWSGRLPSPEMVEEHLEAMAIARKGIRVEAALINSALRQIVLPPGP